MGNQQISFKMKIFKLFNSFIISFLLVDGVYGRREEKKKDDSWSLCDFPLGVLGAGVAVVVAPVVVPAALGAAGFTSAGIAAGSAGASLMSTYGGAVGAGSAVATAQSIGAAGLGTAGTVIAGAFGYGAGKVAENFRDCDVKL